MRNMNAISNNLTSDTNFEEEAFARSAGMSCTAEMFAQDVRYHLDFAYEKSIMHFDKMRSQSAQSHDVTIEHA